MNGTYNPGFAWGNVSVTRMTHIDGRGRTVLVAPLGKARDGITVYVSEGGRSVRAFKNGQELFPREGHREAGA